MSMKDFNGGVPKTIMVHHGTIYPEEFLRICVSWLKELRTSRRMNESYEHRRQRCHISVDVCLQFQSQSAASQALTACTRTGTCHFKTCSKKQPPKRIGSSTDPYGSCFKNAQWIPWLKNVKNHLQI